MGTPSDHGVLPLKAKKVAAVTNAAQAASALRQVGKAAEVSLDVDRAFICVLWDVRAESLFHMPRERTAAEAAYARTPPETRSPSPAEFD